MWQSEEHFIDHYAELLPCAADAWRQVPIVWRERRTGYGRPDVLLLDTCPNVLAGRLSLWQHPVPISKHGAYLMAYLQHRRWTSVSRAAAYLHVSPSRAHAIVAELGSRNLVYRRPGCVRARPLNECMVIKGVVAFEAKLREWRRAVEQARRHLWFARESYVVLANSRTTITEKVAAVCRSSGVGLIVPGTDGYPNLIVRPTASMHTRHNYVAWLLNEQLVDLWATGQPN